MKKSSQNSNSLLRQALKLNEIYGIFVLSPSGSVLSWNQGAFAVQGYSEHEVIGKPFGALYEKEVIKPSGYFDILLEKAKIYGYFEEEGWRQHKKGYYFWSNILINPLYDDAHNLIGYSLFSRDLTENKLASELSEISESSIEATVLSTSNIIWVRSLDGQINSPQLQWEHFTGQIWPEYQGFGWLKMHPPEEHEKIKTFWRTLQASDITELKKNWQAIQQPSVNKKLLLHTRVWSKIHQEYRFIITAVVPRFQNEKNVSWVGNEKDIHKMKVLEDKLKNTLEDQRLIIHSARIGLWRWDLKTNLIKLDQNVADYFGITLESFQGSLAEIFVNIHVEDQLTVQNALQIARQTGQSFKAEFRVVWPDNSIHYVAGNSEVQCDEQHNPVQVLGSYWDVTERKDLENTRLQAVQLTEEKERLRAQEAEAYKQKLEEFIDTICHEVRNPLNGIYSSITFLKDALVELQIEQEKLNTKISEKIAEVIALIKEQTETLDKCATQQKVILDDALDLSKLENDKIELNTKPFSLKTCIDYILQIFQAKILEKKLKVIFSADLEIFLVADQQRLAQVIINLVANAIKFTEAGTIQIHAALDPSAPETTLQIAIKDTGIGMTPEECARLFQKFGQANRETASKYGGSGLGLVISKKLVERMGGTIQVTSQKGQGTEFLFNIHVPILSALAYANLTAVSATATLALASPNPSKTILIADDNVMNQTILKRYLTKAGHTCQVANNGQEAVTHYEPHKFDLIFMDIEMPEMNGLQATEEIRKKEQLLGIRVPIIGLSGNAGNAQREAALKRGMDDYVTKPYQQEDIYRVIDRHTLPALLPTSTLSTGSQESSLASNTLSLSSSTAPAYSTNLFAPKKTKQEVNTNLSSAKRLKTNPAAMRLSTLSDLLQSYKKLPNVDIDYIATVEQVMNFSTVQVQSPLIFEAHILMLETLIKNNQLTPVKTLGFNS